MRRDTAFRNRIYFILLALVAQLLLFGYAAEPLGSGGAALAQQIIVPASLPAKDRLILLSLLPLIFDGKIVGAVAEFDDIATARPADYLELYDSAGNLFAVSWFDRFGIRRTAVDRGLLENGDELEGVLVLILEGESV